MKKFAFTLAEIMIVLSVIAVLTAILLPAARNATPNEDVMKFKKAHLTFVNVINELVNSDKYYLNGDLGVRPNNALIDGTHEGDNTYFCNTFADVLGNVKEKDCQQEITKITPGIQYYLGTSTGNTDNARWLDGFCRKYQENSFLPAIVLSDGTHYYESTPSFPFGGKFKTLYEQLHGNLDGCIRDGNCEARLLDGGHRTPAGSSSYHKSFCMDIDGFNQGEAPFGYGIRKDGKIFFGARATEWFKKTIQDKD